MTQLTFAATDSSFSVFGHVHFKKRNWQRSGENYISSHTLQNPKLNQAWSERRIELNHFMLWCTFFYSFSNRIFRLISSFHRKRKLIFRWNHFIWISPECQQQKEVERTFFCSYCKCTNFCFCYSSKILRFWSKDTPSKYRFPDPCDNTALKFNLPNLRFLRKYVLFSMWMKNSIYERECVP